MSISIIIAQRGHPEKLRSFLCDVVRQSYDMNNVDVLVAIDDDDHNMVHESKDIGRIFDFVKFYVVKQSDHHSKDYWNFLAKKAEGRWIIPICCDNRIETEHWDNILMEKMSAGADAVGDDIIMGLTKDNLVRTKEDPVYPNFSCHPVMSRQYVQHMGYMFDERYWTWGTDQVAAKLFYLVTKMLRQQRVISLMDVKVYDYNTVHTSHETDPAILEKLRQADSGYMKNLRISQEHPFSITRQQLEEEARKVVQIIRRLHV